MDDFQFLKNELSNPKFFNKRIFYARNANKFIDLISIDLFVDKYLPYITNYILNDENTEEVLTEYSKTFINFLKYLNEENTYLKYMQIKNKENINNDEKNKYNECIDLILKCFFEKFFIFEDEILNETSINNMKDLLLELSPNSLLKKEIENYLNNSNDNNKNINENKDINYENEVLFLFYSLLYPFIEDNEQKIENYCNKLKSILKNNNQLKKKRLIIQNIINIIPFIKKSIENIKNNNVENNQNNQNKIKHNIYIIKEILNSLYTIIDNKNLIIMVGMNYLCEIIIIYAIKNMTDIILFYDEYNSILSDENIDMIVNNFINKLANFMDNESILKISLTWRIKVAYIENICRLNKFILSINPNYFINNFACICQKILENNNINNFNNDVDLKISVLKHVEYFIPKLLIFIHIFKNIISIEQNVYIRSNLGIALNKILNNKQFYQIFKNNNFNVMVSDILNIIQNIIEKDKFDVKYYLLSSFEFNFFNIIEDDNIKIKILNRSFKLIIIVFETINEWRIRYSIYEKVEQFLSNEKKLLKIINIYQMEKNQNNEQHTTTSQLINNIRYLIQLFFKDKANIIRTNCLNLIETIIKIEKDTKIETDICFIRVKEELIKYQFSLFLKNNTLEDIDYFNYISSLDINKNYCVKIFFLDSVKKFIHLYSMEEKNIIKDVIELIKNDKKYSKENIANIKINKDIEFILEKINF